jgi:hypothetical protein
MLDVEGFSFLYVKLLKLALKAAKAVVLASFTDLGGNFVIITH